MKALDKIKNIYFIGIGGIGMSALARYFHSKGALVSGYDRTRSELTIELELMGITIHYREDLNLISRDADAVVYTPAVPLGHKELTYYRANNYNVMKRSEVLQLITENSFNICVGGTHGKTTTTTLIAHILRHSDYGCNAFLGGISANYNTNFWSSENNVCVVEADEYDRSFLKLSPDVAVITAMDPDHLDIYGNEQEVQNAFVQFTKRVKAGGCLISKYGLARSSELNAAHHFTYAMDNHSADIYAANIRVVSGAYHFDVVSDDWTVKNVVLHMGGLHNIENSVAAVAVARYLGIDDRKIIDALESFKGVKRRFEYIIRNDSQVLIDDYAHHPKELEALIKGVRSIYDGRMTIVFQPHLYTRTQDLADGFAASLDLADQVILLPVYPARELPIEGVESGMILDRMKLNDKMVLGKEEMLQWTRDNKPSLLVMAGAGDIDLLVEPVKEIMMNG
ncbi:MAG TPA: UDP-N-acetylmuramate--L-alanine ligase [Chitinophagaceae bacterium]